MNFSSPSSSIVDVAPGIFPHISSSSGPDFFNLFRRSVSVLISMFTAFEGPDISFDIIATAEGYAEGQDIFTVNVDAPEKIFDSIDLELPEWIIYIVIGGVLMVGVVVFMFLKKSKTNLEEEWEDEEEL